MDLMEKSHLGLSVPRSLIFCILSGCLNLIFKTGTVTKSGAEVSGVLAGQ